MNKRYKLYIEDRVCKAIQLKIDLALPHIHLSIEEDCDPFTSALMWIEVLSRGVQTALTQGACIISYSDSHVYQEQLSPEEQKIIKKMQETLDKKMEPLHIIDNRK